MLGHLSNANYGLFIIEDWWNSISQLYYRNSTIHIIKYWSHGTTNLCYQVLTITTFQFVLLALATKCEKCYNDQHESKW